MLITLATLLKINVLYMLKNVDISEELRMIKCA